tara:strand:- start:173 stop:586 length:414 start_codon:yes stop_codon:yes gene_type:complete
MTINSKIKPLLPYLKEIKFGEKHVVVGGALYPKWIVDESGTNGQIKTVKTGEDESGKVIYHFYGLTTQIDIDGLLEYFGTVINENLDRERKDDLFKKKVEELKGIFKGNTLTDLEHLSMDITEDEMEERPGYTQIDD